MSLFSIVAWVGAITLLLISVSLVGIVGRDRLRTFTQDPGSRLREIAPYVVFLVVVLGLTSAIRDVGPEISWIIGTRIDVSIHAFEGKFIAWIQSFATPAATTYLSLVYIYGYVYLLVFPFVAYALMDDLRTFRVMTMAYVLNYVIGLVCYVLFIAFGPRNFLVGESLLYTAWPESQFLTSEINHNTNVFPSLHASLSVTVAVLSLRTWREYRVWPVIAVPLALSVCFSTMYLGIHWATDVVAGFGLAVLSIFVSDRVHDRFQRRMEQSRELWADFTDRASTVLS